MHKSGATSVYLRDVATIAQGTRPSQDFIKIDSKDSINIRVHKSPDINTLGLLLRLNRTIDELNSTTLASNDLRLVQSFDSTPFLTNALTVGITSLIATVICLFVVLCFYYRRIWESVEAMTGILFSVCGGISVLFLTEMSLNLLSLAALVISAGISVDSTIIMQEAIASSNENNRAVKVSSVRRPIYLSALTSIIVLIPILLTEGTVRALFAPVALVLATGVLLSVVWSTIVIPRIRLPIPGKKRNIQFRFAQTRSGSFGKPIAFVIILAMGSVPFFSIKQPELLPTIPNNSYYMYLVLNQVPSRDYLEREVFDHYQRESKKISDFDEVIDKEVFFHFDRTATAAVLYCAKDTSLSKRCNEIVEGLAMSLRESPLVVSSVVRPGSLLSFGNSDRRGLRLDISGIEYEQLKALAIDVQSELKTLGLTSRLVPNISAQRPILDVYLDEFRWSGTELNTSEFEKILASATSGFFVSEVFVDGMVQDLMIHQITDPQKNPVSLAQVNPLPTQQFTVLGDYSRTSKSKSDKALFRVDGVKTIRLEIYPGARLSLEEAEDITTQLISEPKYSSVQTTLDILSNDKGRILSDLAMLEASAALLLAISLFVFFKSFRLAAIAATIYPICIGAGFIGIAVFTNFVDAKIDLLAYLGFAVLAGLVSNNAILFVDAYSRHGTIGRAFTERLPGIVLATATSVIGTAVLTFLPGEGARIFRSIAYVISFGILLGVPLAYVAIALLLDKSGYGTTANSDDGLRS